MLERQERAAIIMHNLHQMFKYPSHYSDDLEREAGTLLNSGVKGNLVAEMCSPLLRREFTCLLLICQTLHLKYLESEQHGNQVRHE